MTHLISYVFFVSSFYISMSSNSGFRRHILKTFQRSTERDSTTTTGSTFRTVIITSYNPPVKGT